MIEVHKFEAAGLGKAPFQFLGVNEKVFYAFPGDTGKAGSSCDYCGTGIRYEFWCVSSDGKKFKVGCDCIYKIESKTKLYNDVERADRQLKRNLKDQRDSAVIKAAKEKFEANPEMFAGQVHPMISGKTMRDYVEWMFRCAGTSGMLRVSKLVNKA